MRDVAVTWMSAFSLSQTYEEERVKVIESYVQYKDFYDINWPFIIFSGFDELMTPAEKSKLYAAIGYSETAVNPNLPKNVSDCQSLPYKHVCH